jgi:hypothetical protein
MDVTVKLATTTALSSTWIVVSSRDALCSVECTVTIVGVVERGIGPTVEKTRPAGFGEA